MEFLGYIWDFLFGFFIQSYHYFVTWFQNAEKCGFVISKSYLIEITFVMIVLCGSVMATMTIAELKFRNRIAHGIVGFILPVIYPVLFFFIIPPLKKKTADDDEDMNYKKIAKKEVPKSELKTFNKKKASVTEAIPESDVLDQNYFTRIAKDEMGNLRGPFMVELDDDQILEVECIIEALQPAVAVQIGQGEKAKKIRLPYARIKKCITKEQWLAESEVPDIDDIEQNF